MFDYRLFHSCVCVVVFSLLDFTFLFFFFSSRRRHTRCALVTGVQTCALPIYRPIGLERHELESLGTVGQPDLVEQRTETLDLLLTGGRITLENVERSAERRVGKEWVSKG